MLTVLAAALVGAVVADRVGAALIVRAPPRLLRENVTGVRVPAVLGLAVVTGGAVACAGLLFVYLARGDGDLLGSALGVRITLATLIVIVVLGAAGWWDDLRGRERPRGFAGHLGAFRRLQLTGGLVKIAAGLVAGAGAALLLGASFTGAGLTWMFQVVALVGLGANFINLLDRAPGRAGKVALAAAVVLIAFGLLQWGTSAAGLFGALAACLPADLRARGMLGDAGANPLGGAIGLGLAVSLPSAGRWIVIGLLLILNLISERYSFSRYIAKSPPLKRLDMLGRDREP